MNKDASDLMKLDEYKNTIIVEIQSGEVEEVHNRPSDWDYVVLDWDICSECGHLPPYCDMCKEGIHK